MRAYGCALSGGSGEARQLSSPHAPPRRSMNQQNFLGIDHWYSPGSTLKKKKGQISDQCGAHHHLIGGLTHAKTQGLGPTVSQSGLFLLSAAQPWQHERHLHLYDAEWQAPYLPL